MKLLIAVRNSFDSLNIRNGHYLLAFSGGPDSVYLLEALAAYFKEQLNKQISLCYINYHDSPFVDQEEKLVNHYVSKYKLKLFKFDTHFSHNGNFEEWARYYRYKKFQIIVKKNNLDGLLTAHQKDDDIETYILQKERKNLPIYFGLNQISYLNNLKIIRPILSISKQTIYEALHKNHLYYYEDITNHDNHTRRNIIRLGISTSEKHNLLIEKNKRNLYLKKLYSKFSAIKQPYSFQFYHSLNEEEQRRFCFFIISSYKIKSSRKSGLGKEIFEFLKKSSNSSLSIKKNILLYRTKEHFFIYHDFNNMTYSFTYHQKKIYHNKYFTIDLTDISKFNLKSLPVTIRNAKLDDQICTDLPTKNVYAFLKKQQVPAFLYPAYPVFLINNKIKCVPFFKDIKNKKIPLKLFLLS